VCFAAYPALATSTAKQLQKWQFLAVKSLCLAVSLRFNADNLCC
jgi:hypothetical protein